MSVQMDVQMEFVCNKMKNKRGMSAWIWILIVLILLAVGVGVYFWLSGGSVGGIPQPPALPD